MAAYTSEGEWYPFKYESQDGYDTVEWAAALPYSNGKVGMFGGSYVGATQMLTAIAAPPHLAGILPVVTASNYHENWTYQGGAFEQWFDQSWTTGLAENTLDRRMAKDSYATRWDTKLPLTDYPLLDLGTPTGLADYYLDWLAHPSYDDYWKPWSIEEHYSQIQVPALHVAAWYDLFQDGSFRNYLGIKAHGGSEAARNGQRLLVIVGGHAGSGPVIGEVDFGKDSVMDEEALTLRWYDYLLKGVENGMGSEKPVKLFVMGKNAWREEEGWPLARAQETRYYLHSAGQGQYPERRRPFEPPSLPPSSLRTSTSTTLRTPRRLAAGLSAATGLMSLRALSTSGPWRTARTCWSTPLPLLSRTRK